LKNYPSRPAAQDVGVWSLYCQDRREAVLILECVDGAEAQQVLNTLALAKAGLIRIDIIPLMPYPGFARLFAEEV